TLELILGLEPMSQFDSAARPMFGCFTDQPDPRPYTHIVPQIDLQEKNKASAWGAKQSAGFDWTKEDRADPLLLNEIIWRSVNGADARMPAPVRAAFFIPRAKKEKPDDDD